MKNFYKFLISLYFVIRNYFTKAKKPEKVLDKMKLSMEDFSSALNQMDYKYDPLMGLMDYVADPDTFFDEKDSGRDCDDWARMWSWWLTYNGYEATEYCVTNSKTIVTLFSNMHMISIGHKDNEWWLMNYRNYGPFNSFEDAINYMNNFSAYSDVDNFIYIKTPTKFDRS